MKTRLRYRWHDIAACILTCAASATLAVILAGALWASATGGAGDTADATPG